jgi:hypothetical protein
MLQPWQYYARGRPWIAFVAAYALALQTLLSAFAGPSFAADDVGDAFSIICQSGHSGDPQGGSNVPRRHAPCCMFCTLACGSPAILGADQPALAALAAPVSDVVRPRDEHVMAFFSFTGRYPRGPPATILAS